MFWQESWGGKVRVKDFVCCYQGDLWWGLPCNWDLLWDLCLFCGEENSLSVCAGESWRAQSHCTLLGSLVNWMRWDSCIQQEKGTNYYCEDVKQGLAQACGRRHVHQGPLNKAQGHKGKEEHQIPRQMGRPEISVSVCGAMQHPKKSRLGWWWFMPGG